MNIFFNFIEVVIEFVLKKIFKISLTKEKSEAIIQFIKFGIVGLSNTVISYVLYLVALLSFQRLELFPKFDYLIAHIIAFALSVLWSFYWNNKYVFKNSNGKRNVLCALLKTYISYGFTGLFLNSILSVIWVEIVGLSKLISPIINLFVSVPVNFIMNKFWAFKNTD